MKEQAIIMRLVRSLLRAPNLKVVVNRQMPGGKITWTPDKENAS